MEGLRYNRAVRMHKLVYEALIRQARSGFSTWVTKHNEKESLVDDMFSCLQISRNNVCEAEYQAKLSKSSFSEITELFERYMNFFAVRMVDYKSSG